MVFEFPPRLSFRSHVRTESRYGMKMARWVLPCSETSAADKTTYVTSGPVESLVLSQCLIFISLFVEDQKWVEIFTFQNDNSTNIRHSFDIILLYTLIDVIHAIFFIEDSLLLHTLCKTSQI